MNEILNTPIEQLIRPEGFACDCGKRHCALPLKYLAIDPGCIDQLPEALKAVGAARPFLVMDENGRRVAGYRAMELLASAGFSYGLFCFEGIERVLPNEEGVAAVEAAFDGTCDFILGVGSGVINDLCKMVAHSRSMACGIVATAPSMDGYASNSSAMELGGVKTTVYTTCPALILCDTEIMRQAPEIMLCSGFGDMAAKIISIADWRISHLVTGEYYCPAIARLMLNACRRILDSAQGIAGRDEAAIRCLTEGLILSGIASSFAGVSRPASGMEHTVSHLLEMFALARNRTPALHGIQVGYGLRSALKLYEAAYGYEPSGEKFAAAHDAFDSARWERDMRDAFGEQAQELIGDALAEKRNETATAARHFAAAREHWAEIQEIIGEVLRQKQPLEAALDRMHIPALDEPEAMGYTRQEAQNAVKFSRDLRSRYIFTSLCWDIGLISY